LGYPRLILWGPGIYYDCPVVIVKGRRYFRCIW
jgi:hypothetical protein